MYIVHYICITTQTLDMQAREAKEACIWCSFGIPTFGKKRIFNSFFWTCLYMLIFHIALVYHFGLDFPFLISHFTFYIRNHLKRFHNKLETELQPSYIYYNQMTTAIQGITTHTPQRKLAYTDREKENKNYTRAKKAQFLFCLLKW